MATRLDSIVFGTPDPVRAADWYRAHLNLAPAPGDAMALDAGGVRLVFVRRPREWRLLAPNQLIINFAVVDLPAVEASLIESGTLWARELMTTPSGRIGTVLDSDGNYVQVLESPLTRKCGGDCT